MRPRRLPFLRRVAASFLAAVVLLGALATLPASPAFAQEQRARRWSLMDLFAPPRRIEQRQRVLRKVKKPRKKVRRAAPAEPEIAIVDKAADARTVLVVGDFLGGGVAEGLQQVYAQQPAVRIIDRTKGSSGFVREDFYNWPAEIDGLVAAEKPAVVIFMIGANDRQQIKVGEERQPVGSDAWMAEYATRAGSLGDRLKEMKLPFLWVGMPAFKSAKMSSDMTALNAVYEAAAEAAGGEFIDIWDGFVDETGAFVSTGPDINGQPARLRASDGVNMTAAGKRKMAFYVEKPLARLLGVGPAIAGLRGPLDSADPGDALSITPVDRTAPISLMDPDLDGGAELLGAVVEPARRAAGGAQAIGGVARQSQAGRADDFAFAPVQPGLTTEETAAASR